eukprot:245266-Prorocentrum_minimum.AAC.1
MSYNTHISFPPDVRIGQPCFQHLCDGDPRRTRVGRGLYHPRGDVPVRFATHLGKWRVLANLGGR